MQENHISELQVVMKNRGVGAILIPTADEHANEYVGDHWKTRAYFSGFTGSAGTLVVLQNEAALWTDSRYFLQAEQELKLDEIQLMKDGEQGTPTIVDWVRKKMRKNERILLPNKEYSVRDFLQLKKGLRNYKIEDSSKFINMVWKNRPAIFGGNLFVYEDEFAGESVLSKLYSAKAFLRAKKCDVMFLNDSASIAWIFNIRGTDVRYTPIAYAFAMIRKNGNATIFVNLEKVTAELKSHFEKNGVEVCDYGEFYTKIQLIKGESIFIDEAKNSSYIYEIVNGKNKIVMEGSFAELKKSIRNRKQLKALRYAMEKDGVALVRFWIWLEKILREKNVVTEIIVAKQLRKYREEQENFFDESFSPIVAYGAHGAIVHYEATEETNAVIKAENFLLIDTGAQFLEGTTDVTRTFALGMLSAEEKRNFTLVLKGHIALAMVVFPMGTCGCHLDVLARQFLWKDKKNYGHGTGHGVGHFLCVHEGPESIRQGFSKVPLKIGMVMSNEPGIYIENCYGIRLENLVMVQKEKTPNEKSFLSFETLTLCPFDKLAMDFSLITDEEKEWLNAYHRKVYNRLKKYLTGEEKMWLQEKCSPIK